MTVQREWTRSGVRVPIEERFWQKVDKRGPDECWLWLGAVEPSGYAKITESQKKFYVHRFSYELHFAPIPPGRWINVCHSCDTKLCVNPRHLWLGTAQANVDEAKVRGLRRYPGPTKPQRGEDHHAAVLTAPQVVEMRRRYQAGSITGPQLAREYGISKTTAHSILNRRSWRHVD